MEENLTTNSKNKYKRLLNDTGLFAISGFASKILIFLLTPLYTALLATEEYGVIDLINTTINLLFPILTLAITDATLRFAMNSGSSKRSVLANSFFIIACSFLVLLCLYPLSGFVESSLRTYWGYFLVIYVLTSFHESISNYVKSIGKTKIYAIQGVIQTIIVVSLNLIFLLWLKMGLEGYLLSLIFGSVSAIAFMIIFGKVYIDIFPYVIDWKLLKEMLIYSMPLIPAVLAWFVNTSIDKFMIIGMFGMSDSGIYSIAHKIPTIITTIVTFFINAWTLSAIHNHGSDDESDYTTNVYNVLNFLLVAGCIIVILLDKFLAKILFANDYYIAWKYVPFLTVSAVFSALSGFLAGPYRAAKKTLSLLISVIIGAVVNVGLNIAFLNTIGVVGAAIATAVSFFIVWLVRVFIVQKIVVVKPNITTTTLSYLCMITAAVITSFEIRYAMYICLGLFALTIIVNYKNIILCASFIKLFFRKKQDSKMGERK